MNHSCENTSLQNVSVENLQFPVNVWRLEIPPRDTDAED